MRRPSMRAAMRLFLVLSVSLFGFASTAPAQINTIEICNQGNVDVSVAMVWSYKGLLGFGSTDSFEHKGKGWTRVQTGSCEEMFRSADIWSDRAYFAVAYVDRSGAAGLYDFTPEPGSFFSRSAFSRSDAVFCVATDSAFSMSESNRDAAGAWCGSGRERDGKWWSPVPFILQWDRVRGAQNNDRHYTFTIRPDGAARVAWRFPAAGGSARTGARTGANVRSGVPKPFEPGTVNGVWLSYRIVRWKENTQWYLYGSDQVPEPFWQNSEFDKSFPLGDLDLPDQPQAEIAIGNVSKLMQALVGEYYSISIYASGRISIWEGEFAAGKKVQYTANISDIDISRVRVEKAQGPMASLWKSLSISPRGLSVACKRTGCITRWVGWIESVSARSEFRLSMPYADGSPEPSAEALKEAIGKALALLRKSSFVIEENGKCSCTVLSAGLQ